MRGLKTEDRLSVDFFQRDVLEVAPALLGKQINLVCSDNSIRKFTINEVEAYRGEEDLACHASKGCTDRTKVMYRRGGCLYIYLIYGLYRMINIVTGPEGHPQAVLIRGLEEVSGPGRVSRLLGITKDYNGEELTLSSRIWITNGPDDVNYLTATRVGVEYAGEIWKNKLWRFYY